MGTEKISVIIPVLNEIDTITRALVTIQQATNVEVIVVDGGSQDGTVELVKSLGLPVIQTEAGRAKQMNAGAIAASGDILLFLHADTCLPGGFAEIVRQTLAQPDIVAGAFDLSINSSGLGLRLIEWMVKWRSRYLQMVYGDQAIFLRSEAFYAIGQFPELPIMEDFELSRRLRQQGRIAIISVPVLTSGRRWQRLGVLKTTIINQLIVAAYLLGVTPAQLAKWYHQNSPRIVDK